MGNFRTTTGEILPLANSQRKTRLRIGLSVTASIVAAIAATGFLVHLERYVTAPGYVTTEQYAEVRSPVNGKVGEILVESGTEVAQGDILVKLDSSQELSALAEVQGLLRMAEAEAARRRVEIAGKRREIAEDITILELRLQNNERKLARTRGLFDKGLVPVAEIEDLEFDRDLTTAQLQEMRGRDLAIFDRELEVLEREIDIRRDAVCTAEMRVANRLLRAPIGGQVLRYEFVIGETVGPDTVLFEIFGGTRQIVKLKVAERFATMIAAGQRYTAVLAPYRSPRKIIFAGTVEGLRNVIQGDEQRTYRIAYCSFDPGARIIPPGTTCEARIYYGKSNLWKFIFGID
jgi:multidrug resistance efflux pump